ncbi:MAG: Multicopper oxidase [Modestobacter sp.]|nr:Multicopper oxidase [Modestobacter sp.]
MLLVAVAVLAAVTTARWSTEGAAAAAAEGPAPRLRTYCIAADSVPWDYAPHGINDITGQPWDETAATFAQAGPARIGSTYVTSLLWPR